VNVELADRERFDWSLPAESGAVPGWPCPASIVGTAAIATGVAVSCTTGDGTRSAEGAGAGWLGAAVATAEDTSVWSTVAEAADAVSLLEVVELVSAPPELCTTPDRGSGVEAPLDEEVELAWAPTELSALSGAEPDEESAAEADVFVDDAGSVVDVLAADSADELVSDGDESDDELEELESVGSAYATPGVFATAAPAPTATTHTPTRTMYCAFPAIAPFSLL
jgi:hypothetical protein